MYIPDMTATAVQSADMAARLREAGLTPTRQRCALGALLFTGEHRHVTCESLFAEARAAGAKVSLATVYNTLHQFRDAGLLREVSAASGQRVFDTNTSAHHHFYVEDTGELIDIPDDRLELSQKPRAPKGYAVDGVDIVVRLRSSSQS